MCRSDLEKPAGRGRGVRQGDQGWRKRRRGLALTPTLFTSNASSSLSPHLWLSSESVYLFFIYFFYLNMAIIIMAVQS